MTEHPRIRSLHGYRLLWGGRREVRQEEYLAWKREELLEGEGAIISQLSLFIILEKNKYITSLCFIIFLYFVIFLFFKGVGDRGRWFGACGFIILLLTIILGT